MRESRMSLNICTNNNVVIDHGTYNTKVKFYLNMLYVFLSVYN